MALSVGIFVPFFLFMHAFELQNKVCVCVCIYSINMHWDQHVQNCFFLITLNNVGCDFVTSKTEFTYVLYTNLLNVNLGRVKRVYCVVRNVTL